MTNADGSTGFFGSLFDFTFSNFITTKLVPVLYGLGLLAAGIMALFFIIGGFSQGSGMGLLFLILSPLVFLFAAMYMRVMLEVMIVLFRISEDVKRVADTRGVA